MLHNPSATLCLGCVSQYCQIWSECSHSHTKDQVIHIYHHNYQSEKITTSAPHLYEAKTFQSTWQLPCGLIHQIRFEKLLAITSAAEHHGTKLEIRRVRQGWSPATRHPVLHEKVYLSKIALQAITPRDGVILSAGGAICVCVCVGGCLQPGGDLISEISLRLTKLSVKQSLVGNHAGGFWVGRYKRGTLKGWEDMETVSVWLVWEEKRSFVHQKSSDN